MVAATATLSTMPKKKQSPGRAVSDRAAAQSYKDEFAAKLKSLREAAGLTQRSAAEKMQELGYFCGHSKWAHWETGLASPPMNALPFIASVLGVSKISEIFP